MRFTHKLLLAALLAPFAAHAQAPAQAHAQAQTHAQVQAQTHAPAQAQTQSAASAVKSDVPPAPDSTTFVVGKRLYLRSTSTFIGTIIEVEENHDFRAGHFPRPWMKGVLLVRRDGPYEWVPVEGLSRLYYAK